VSERAQALRLCIVTPAHSSTTAGGSEFQIDCLVEALIAQKRFEVYYLTAFVADDAGDRAYNIVRIGDGMKAPRFGYLAHSVPLYRALSHLRPTVIYQRVASGYSGIAAWYARRHGAQFVWHVAHDSDVTPHASLEGRNLLRRYLEKRSVEYAIRHADRIVTQTAHQARLLEQHYGRKADAIIPNFQPAPREALDKTGPLTVVWIASLKPWKHPEAFVELAAQLSDLSGVRFLLVGPWAAGGGQRRWIEELTQQMQRTANLEYLGPRTQAGVNAILANAHVFVNTSAHEGFPNTFIQAWSREVAVVSLHVDPDGLLTTQRLGMFCDGSQEKLASNVRQLLADPALRTQYTTRGSVHARSKHSLTNAYVLADLFEARVAA
jgi:glycosyltransferase involved in cell wall biosynthesis